MRVDGRRPLFARREDADLVRVRFGWVDDDQIAGTCQVHSSDFGRPHLGVVPDEEERAV